MTALSAGSPCEEAPGPVTRGTSRPLPTTSPALTAEARDQTERNADHTSSSTKEQSPSHNISHQILSEVSLPLASSKAAPGAELETEKEKKVLTTSEAFKEGDAKATAP